MLGAGAAFSVVTAGVSSATAQELEWAIRGISGGAIATDPRGNSYVTGGNNLAKYAPDGTLIWARTLISTDDDAPPSIADEDGGSAGGESSAIATDTRGNSYVTGTFFGIVIFGAGEDNETVLFDTFGTERRDVFVAKYDQDGRFLWATQFGDTNYTDEVRAIAVDSHANSYVTGSFTPLEDIFVATFDPNGGLIWARTAGGASDDNGFGIATDNRGNSYVTGFFSSSVIFVAKYDRNGGLIWVRTAGGATVSTSHCAQGSGIAIDNRGNSYVTGFFSGMATFGAGEEHETVLRAAADRDIFVAKYDRDGNLLWATSAGGAGRDAGSGIATDHRGNSYITGNFEEMATFGAGEVHETVLEAAGPQRFDVFVAKYSGRSDQDRCPDSDPSPTVVIAGNDTGVANVLTSTEGCTILDLILQASDDAADRTEFIRKAALLTRTLLRDGLITEEDAGIIRTAASQATFPLS